MTERPSTRPIWRRAIVGAVAAAVVLVCLGGLASAQRFEGRLILEDVAFEFSDSGPYDPGHTEFRLVEPYVYIAADGRRFTVPAGAIVNGASIPQPVWSWIGGPWSGAYRNAAVLHDFMCEQPSISSEQTHALFLEAMLASGVEPRIARVMHRAVLLGGPRWDMVDGVAVQRDRSRFTDRDLLRVLVETGLGGADGPRLFDFD